MKLLLITSTYPIPQRPHQGVFNENLVRALSASHEIRVIAPIPWTDANRFSRESSAPGKPLHPVFYYPPGILRWTYGWWYWYSIRTAFQKLVRDFRPDVVLGYWAHPDSDAAIQGARTLGVPCVVMVGGTDIRILAQSGLRRRAIRTVLHRAHQVVAFSRDLGNHVLAMGVPSGRIHVLYRGVDPSRFFPGNRDKARQKLQINNQDNILLWIGRLVEIKNPKMAIQAMAFLKDKLGHPVKLIMIGDGPLRKELQEEIARLRLQDNCQLIGALPHEELADWYRAANVTILTSVSEGVPNVLLESIACGTSFVATDVGGVREIADPQHDILIASEDTKGLERAILQKLSAANPPLRPSSTHNVQTLARQLTSLLEGL